MFGGRAFFIDEASFFSFGQFFFVGSFKILPHQLYIVPVCIFSALAFAFGRMVEIEPKITLADFFVIIPKFSGSASHHIQLPAAAASALPEAVVSFIIMLVSQFMLRKFASQKSKEVFK